MEIYPFNFKYTCCPTAFLFREAPWAAFFGAVLFLVHPVQTQAVNYIVQRAVLLAAFFYMAALVLYIKSNLEGPVKFVSRKGLVLYWGAVGCAVLSVLSKENAVTLPLMIGLYQWFFLKRDLRFNWKRIAPFFLVILIIPFAWHPHLSMGIGRAVDGFGQGMPVGQYALNHVK